ncbi:MAG: HpcH/HpaI aldolase family protein [Chloroflexota bacterium]
MPNAPLPPRGDLRSRVKDGETTIGAWAMLGSPPAAEILARAGFDWLVVDLEHGFGTEADLFGLLHAVQSTTTAAIVRVQSSERLRIGRALDMGADGLMIPRLERESEIREALSWIRYPPDGIRGVALGMRGAALGEIGHDEVRGLNERLLSAFQVESPVAVEAAAELAAIDGVDVLFVGPADLSHSMGMPGRIRERAFLDALRQVVDGCRSNGKAPGILLQTVDDLPAALDQGFTFVGIGSDGGWVRSAARASVAAAREAIAR